MSRRPNDFYETPPEFTQTLLDRVRIRGRVFECCNGDGAITRVMRSRGLSVTTNDVTLGRMAHYHMDARKQDVWDKVTCDWAVSNLPFKYAPDIVPRAYANVRKGIAFLLRVTFLEPCQNRALFLRHHKPSIIVLPRHSFTGDGGVDSTTCAWFIWQKEGHEPLVEILSKEEVWGT